MSTANDWVHSHDGARQVLTYSGLGATVLIEPLPRSERASTREASRQFTMVLDAAPEHATGAFDVYTLPVRARDLSRMVTAQLDARRKQLAVLEIVTTQ